MKYARVSRNRDGRWKRDLAACLYAQGHTQEGISYVLGCSAAAVNGYIRRAIQDGVLRRRLTLNLPVQRRAELAQFDWVARLEGELQKLSRIQEGNRPFHVFQKLHVADSGSDLQHKRAMEKRQARFGASIAPALNDMLQRSQVVGVAWGNTMATVVDALARQSERHVRSRNPLEFVSTCGELPGYEQFKNPSSELVAALDRAVNGSQAHAHRLAGIPALIPKEFGDDRQLSVIKRFLQHAPFYRAIFVEAPGKQKDPRPWISRLDTFLTSIGTARQQWRMGSSRFSEIVGVSQQEFESLVLGDIGGVLVPRVADSRKAPAAFNELCQLWTGIQFEHLRRVAADAKQPTEGLIHWRKLRPGVVVFAVSRDESGDKAELLWRLVQAGVINNLCCDRDLAAALAERCGVEHRWRG